MNAGHESFPRKGGIGGKLRIECGTRSDSGPWVSDRGEVRHPKNTRIAGVRRIQSVPATIAESYEPSCEPWTQELNAARPTGRPDRPREVSVSADHGPQVTARA